MDRSAYIITCMLSFKYYSKKRTAIILENFNNKKTWEKELWGLIAVAMFLAPIILFPILLTK